MIHWKFAYPCYSDLFHYLPDKNPMASNPNNSNNVSNTSTTTKPTSSSSSSPSSSTDTTTTATTPMPTAERVMKSQWSIAERKNSSRINRFLSHSSHSMSTKCTFNSRRSVRFPWKTSCRSLENAFHIRRTCYWRCCTENHRRRCKITTTRKNHDRCRSTHHRYTRSMHRFILLINWFCSRSSLWWCSWTIFWSHEIIRSWWFTSNNSISLSWRLCWSRLF